MEVNQPTLKIEGKLAYSTLGPHGAVLHLYSNLDGSLFGLTGHISFVLIYKIVSKQVFSTILVLVSFDCDKVLGMVHQSVRSCHLVLVAAHLFRQVHLSSYLRN